MLGKEYLLDEFNYHCERTLHPQSYSTVLLHTKKVFNLF